MKDEIFSPASVSSSHTATLSPNVHRSLFGAALCSTSLIFITRMTFGAFSVTVPECKSNANRIHTEYIWNASRMYPEFPNSKTNCHFGRLSPDECNPIANQMHTKYISNAYRINIESIPNACRLYTECRISFIRTPGDIFTRRSDVASQSKPRSRASWTSRPLFPAVLTSRSLWCGTNCKLRPCFYNGSLLFLNKRRKKEKTKTNGDELPTSAIESILLSVWFRSVHLLEELLLKAIESLLPSVWFRSVLLEKLPTSVNERGYVMLGFTHSPS